MLAKFECIPCYFNMALTSSELVNASQEQTREVVNEVARLVPTLTLDKSPAYNSTKLLRVIHRILGVDDPYREAKIHYNNVVMELYPKLVKMVEESSDPFVMAAKLSAVGNVIDLGIRAKIDIDADIRRVFEQGFGIDHSQKLIELLKEPRTILYMVDNSGEIVFDRIFIERLIARGHRVIVGVKSGPVLNDATMEDARQVGLTEITEVVETGSDWIGTELETCAEEFRKLYYSADVAVSKGQANYETLEGSRPDLFVILKAKCDAVARNIGTELGELVLQKSPHKPSR